MFALVRWTSIAPALFVGLLLWLFLMVRVLLPALRKPGEQKQLVTLLAVASAAIALFYGAGLTWGQHSHLSMVEYWRWWVVHLWVEGFFEVFATVVIAFLFSRLQLIRRIYHEAFPVGRYIKRIPCRSRSILVGQQRTVHWD